MVKLTAALFSLRADTETIKRYQDKEVELQMQLSNLRAEYVKLVQDASEVIQARKQLAIMRDKVSEATKINEQLISAY